MGEFLWGEAKDEMLRIDRLWMNGYWLKVEPELRELRGEAYVQLRRVVHIFVE